MPRELKEGLAPAPAPATSVDPGSSKSLPDLYAFEAVVLITIWHVLRLLQFILGPMRCRSGHWLVQYGAMAAYYLPTPVVFSAASAAWASSSSSRIVMLNLTCLLLVWLSSFDANTMAVYHLRDSHRQSWRTLPWLLCLAWLQWLCFRRSEKLIIMGLLFDLALIAGMIFFMLACNWFDQYEYKIKAFADYMTTLESPFFDADATGLLKDCKYPFVQKGCQVISVKDALHQCNQLPADCTVDPDICLSYSLCHLLARRYFGFRCAEEGNEEVRHFALTQLRTNYKRAFTIVEVQLAFLHDHLFASSYDSRILAHSPKLSVMCKAVAGVEIVAFLILVVPNLILDLARKLYDEILEDILAIQYILILPGILVHLYPLLPQHWRRIRNVLLHCSIATASLHRPIRPSVVERCVESINLLRNSYWRDQIGQYSLMKDYDRHSCKKAFVVWIKKIVLSERSHRFIKHHPVDEEDVSVPDKVRELIAVTLRDMSGLPTNGTRSLWRNRNLVPGDLLWTCRQETHTRTILIWHIATCYLDMLPLLVDTDTGSTSNHDVATTLSKYCTYLVAFLPEFLPEHSLTTKILFQQVLKEAKEMLGRKRMSMEEKRAKIQGLELPEDEASQMTFQKGARLARQLEELDPLVSWKVLAEFWTETILYVAPSDNAEAHMEQLAKGGEFVTHLWALLHNAGILKRATEEWSPPQPELPVESGSDHNLREELRFRRSKSLRIF